MAGTAQADCQLKELYQFPLTMQANRPLADVTVNGTPLKALLDTGASGTFIIRNHAERLGLPLVEKAGRKAAGIGGYSKIYTAEIASFGLGGLQAKDFKIGVTGERDTKDFQLILGQSLLAMYDLELDLANNVARFIKAEGCEGKPLAYWAVGKPVSEVRLKDLEERAGTRRTRPQILFDIEINGRWMEAKLDTGAFTSVMTRDAAAQIGITPDSPGVEFRGKSGGLGRATIDNWLTTVDSVSIGGETIKNPKLRFADLFQGTKRRNTFDLLLGADWVRAHRIYIAYSQGKMYFTHNGTSPVFQTVGPITVPDQDEPDDKDEDGKGADGKAG